MSEELDTEDIAEEIERRRRGRREPDPDTTELRVVELGGDGCRDGAKPPLRGGEGDRLGDHLLTVVEGVFLLV